MREILKKIELWGSGFILQSVVGSFTTWVIGPIVVSTQSLWVAFIIMYVINIAKLVLVIFIYDKVSFWLKIQSKRKKASKNNYRKAKRLLLYGYRVLGVVAILGNNFYGMLLVRRRHKGIPRSTWLTVFIGVMVSTLALVLTMAGVFSVWVLIQEELQEVFHFLIPFLIRLYF